MAVSKLYNPNTSQWEPSSGAVPGLVQSVNGFTGAVLLDAAKVGAVDVAKVGNLLTANQASGTDTLGNTTGFGTIYGNTNTVETSTDQAFQGTRSVKVTATSTAISVGATTSIPVVAGQVYTLQLRVRSGAVAAYVINAILEWRNGSDVPGGITASTSWNPTPTSSGWSIVTVTGIAPTGAVYVRGQINTNGAGVAGDVLYCDAWGVWAGAGGEWAMPGTPITNLGHRVTRPNVDDVLVQKWDSGLGRWQTVHYDSGWRNIFGVRPAGYSGGSAQIRRVGHTVMLWADPATSGTFTSADSVDNCIPLAAGFKFPSDYGPAAYTGRNGSTGGVAYWSASANGFRPNYGVAANQACQIYYTWITREAIPTSLPGTLVSAAPA